MLTKFMSWWMVEVVTLPMFLNSEGARDIGTTSFQKNLMYLKNRFLKSAMKNGGGLCSLRCTFTLHKVVQQTRGGAGGT